MRKHLDKNALEAGLPDIEDSPNDDGVLKMIVCRPSVGEREVLQIGRLSESLGLEGDNWATRGSSKTKDGAAHPEQQLNIMNARCIDLIAQERAYWPLAGDQLFIDLNLSADNIPPGTKLSIGTAVIEVTAIPHNGCKKFTERYGIDAVKFVNSPVGKQLKLRGINAKVIQSGEVSTGDVVKKLD